jgi:chemotaxis protein MotB
MAKKPAGLPGWIATFADLATNLLVFFVLMLSMANVDIQAFREMLGSVRDAFGVKIEGHGLYDPTRMDDANLGEGQGEYLAPEEQAGDEQKEEEPTDTEMAEVKAQEKEKKLREETAKDIQEAIAQTKLQNMVEVQVGSQGIRIRVKGGLMFAPGSGELLPEAFPLLDNLVMVLQKQEYYMMVEGHSDSTPIATAQFPSNWELSGFRASAVLRYLLTWGIDPRRLTSVGLADNYPIAPNENTDGRALNRRVEFILTNKPFRPKID